MTKPNPYYLKNKKKCAERSAAWAAANRERTRELGRAYYLRNRQKTIERAAAWRRANCKKTILTRAKSRAKRKGLPFDLEIDDLHWPTHCPILGTELDYDGRISVKRNSASLDRIVAEEGYVRGNVRIVSMRANAVKSDASAEEVMKVAEYMQVFG